MPLTESSGTALDIGRVADGKWLKRSGTGIIGSTATATDNTARSAASDAASAASDALSKIAAVSDAASNALSKAAAASSTIATHSAAWAAGGGDFLVMQVFS